MRETRKTPEKPGEGLTPNLFSDPFRSELEEIVKKAVREAMGQNGTKEEGRLISAKEAAKRWEVPKTWIEEKARKGELPCVRLGYYVRFNPDDLEKFIKERMK